MKFRSLAVILFCFLVSVHGQQSDDFPVPASFRSEGIPRIKNDDVKHLFFEPSAIKNNLIWDVDRTARKLFVTDEKNAIYSVESPLAKPKLALDGRVPSTLRVNTTSSVVAFNTDKDDPDNYALFLWDGKSEARKLSRFDGKDDSVDSFVWDRDGKSIYYTLNDYEAKTTKLCQSDLAASKCFAVELKGLWNVIDNDRGNILLKYWKSSSNQHIYLYSIGIGKLTPLSESGNATKAFFLDGRPLALSEDSPECGGGRCLISVDPRTGTKEIISLKEVRGHLGDIKPSPDGKSLLIQEAFDGIDSLWIGRLKRKSIVPAVPNFLSGSYVVWNTRWLSRSEVVFTVENIGQPAFIKSFDLKTKKTTVWTKRPTSRGFDGDSKASRERYAGDLSIVKRFRDTLSNPPRLKRKAQCLCLSMVGLKSLTVLHLVLSMSGLRRFSDCQLSTPTSEGREDLETTSWTLTTGPKERTLFEILARFSIGSRSSQTSMRITYSSVAKVTGGS